MPQYNKTSAVIDTILKILVTSSSLGATLVVPNSLVALDKPLEKFYKTMDERSRKRELQRVLYYMKQRGLVSGNYQHGIKISDRGIQRLQNTGLEQLAIARPERWDHKWRLVIFDIPEKHKTGRDALTRKLKQLGFYPLQRSVLVHPHPCRQEVTAVTAAYGLNKYVSYIETDHIDQDKLLRKQFHSVL
jgi:DNA-binding transcriptional regulator PaaX